VRVELPTCAKISAFFPFSPSPFPQVPRFWSRTVGLSRPLGVNNNLRNSVPISEQLGCSIRTDRRLRRQLGRTRRLRRDLNVGVCCICSANARPHSQNRNFGSRSAGRTATTFGQKRRGKRFQKVAPRSSAGARGYPLIGLRRFSLRLRRVATVLRRKGPHRL